jgi:GT2 family glycosyltransferase
METPTVYIIVLNWNQREDTLKCLNSLRKVEYPNFKVVLVDNGSSDDTAEVIKRDYGWVKLIVNSENLGFTGGNIKGAELALKEGANYVMLLNNDVEVAPDFLTRLIEVAESDERIGAVGPLVYFFEPPDIVWSAGMRMRLMGLYNDMFFWGKRDEKIPDLLETRLITGAALCLKRKVIEEVGFLDDLYFFYNEDTDLCYRIGKAGYKLFTVKASKIWHKVSAATGGSFNPVNQYLMARGRSIFMRKFGTFWERLTFLPLAMVEASYVTTREFLKGNVMAALPKYKGYFDGWRMKRVASVNLLEIKERFGGKKQ